MRTRAFRTILLGLALVLVASTYARAEPVVPTFGDVDLGLQAGYLFGVTNTSQAVTFRSARTRRPLPCASYWVTCFARRASVGD